MIQIFLILFLSITLSFGKQFNMQQPSSAGADMSALKILVHSEPKDLEPEMAVVVGTVYLKGMEELKISKNPTKAKTYFEWASKNKVTMGSFLLANTCYSQKDTKCFVEKMEEVVKAKDPKISIPAAFQLAQFWNNINRTDRAFETMHYTADVYDDDRAQFMVGYSIASGDYIPKGWSKKDGEFYLYQACTNNIQHDEVKAKCTKFMKKKQVKSPK